jgi:O-antigen/teichoic acid export membrane protein
MDSVSGVGNAAARRFIGNASIGTVLQFSSAFITLTVAPYALWKIGLEAYGLWALLTTLTRYVLLADFGIGPSITRHVAQYAVQKDSAAVRSATTIGTLYYLLMAFPVLLLAIFAAPTYLQTLHLSPAFAVTAEPLLLLFVLASMASLILWSSQSATLSGLGQFGNCALVNGIASLAYTIAAFLFLSLNLGAKGLIFATLTQSLVAGTLGHLRLLRLNGGIYIAPWKIEKRILRELITFGAWSQIGTISNLLIYDSPGLIVGSILGIRAVGVLDIGVRLARAIRAIAFNFSGALLPTMSSRHAASGADGVLSLLPHLLRTAAIIAFSATGLLIAASPIVLPLWLGTRVLDFQLVEIVIAGVSITYTIEMLVSVVATSVRGSGLPWLEAWYTVTYATSNLLLLFFLTPRFGLIGTVSAALISVTLAAITFIARCDFEAVVPRRIWSQDRWLLKTFSAWACATFAIFLLSRWMSPFAQHRAIGLAALAAVVLSYVTFKGGLLLLLRAVKREDVNRLRSLLQPGTP